MGKSKKPKAGGKPSSTNTVRLAADPESYLKETPVWRFSDFDWEGPYGDNALMLDAEKVRMHGLMYQTHQAKAGAFTHLVSGE